MKLLLSVVLSASMMFLTSCRNSHPATETHVHEVTIAQWGHSRYLIYLPIYLAESRGFFAKHNINVHLKYSGNDDQVFATVVRGDAQFGVGDPVFTAISSQQGLPGVEVSSIVGRVALWGVGRKGSKHIEKPEDLARLRIGTFPRPSTTYTLLADTLKTNKINAQIIEAQIGSELALLESKRVDVVFLLEPDASLAGSKGYPIVMSLPQLWGPFAFTGLNTTKSYADGHPELTADVAAAVNEALHFAHDDPEGAISDATKLFPSVDAAVVRSAVQRMIAEATIPLTGDIDEQGWLKAVQVRREIGDIKGSSNYLDCLWKAK